MSHVKNGLAVSKILLSYCPLFLYIWVKKSFPFLMSLVYQSFHVKSTNFRIKSCLSLFDFELQNSLLCIVKKIEPEILVFVYSKKKKSFFGVFQKSVDF